jgi:hypothetical protein
MNIIHALDSPKIFAPHFSGAEWAAWRAFLAAVFGLPMTAEERAIYQQCTGRSVESATPAREAWVIAGRRAGKSRISALIAVYLACFKDWSAHLAPGERAVVMCLAADRKQAGVVLRFAKGLLESTPALANLVDHVTAESIHLTNGLAIEVHTSSFRAVRGYSIVAAILDELAFWPLEESANPDTEVVTAIRPAMTTIPSALLIGISSPYAQRGVLWDAYKRYYGKDSDVLVWKAPTRVMNPTVSPAEITRAYELDPTSAAAEYGAEFRGDLSSFLTRDALDRVISRGVTERPPVPKHKYVCFVDLAGSQRASGDSITCAIAHAERRMLGLKLPHYVLDVVREWKPPLANLSAIVGEIVELAKLYGIRQVVGDNRFGQFGVQLFDHVGKAVGWPVRYVVTQHVKNALYLSLLPLVNEGRVELVDAPKLFAQALALERRTGRVGQDVVDHPGHGHDDVINAVAGAIALASEAVRIGAPFQLYSFDPRTGVVEDLSPRPKAEADDENEWEGGEPERHPLDPLAHTRRRKPKMRLDDFTWRDLRRW